MAVQASRRTKDTKNQLRLENMGSPPWRPSVNQDRVIRAGGSSTRGRGGPTRSTARRLARRAPRYDRKLWIVEPVTPAARPTQAAARRGRVRDEVGAWRPPPRSQWASGAEGSRTLDLLNAVSFSRCRDSARRCVSVRFAACCAVSRSRVATAREPGPLQTTTRVALPGPSLALLPDRIPTGRPQVAVGASAAW